MKIFAFVHPPWNAQTHFGHYAWWIHVPVHLVIGAQAERLLALSHYLPSGVSSADGARVTHTIFVLDLWSLFYIFARRPLAAGKRNTRLGVAGWEIVIHAHSHIPGAGRRARVHCPGCKSKAGTFF